MRRDSGHPKDGLNRPGFGRGFRVLPTPTGPCRIADSPAWTNRSVARSRIWEAGIFGL
jgi:hypothetical protein